MRHKVDGSVDVDPADISERRLVASSAMSTTPHLSLGEDMERNSPCFLDNRDHMHRVKGAATWPEVSESYDEEANSRQSAR
eukprot:243233-Hanusia_phi.AAC.1